jgi:hypothetical protein
MKYTVRFCHLADIPGHKAGDIITKYEKIGFMGSTGQSDAPHLHLDCVGGYYSTPWRLSDMAYNLKHPSPTQLSRFLQHDTIFDTELLITSYYCDPYYFDGNGNLVLHMAYDVVPKDRHDTKAHYWIHWPIDENGLVLGVGEDVGYGNYVHIGYEV